jgi:hypothetical protein
MNGEQIKVWKEAAMPISEYRPGICFERLRKTTKKPVRIDSRPAEIRTLNLTNTSLNQWNFT